MRYTPATKPSKTPPVAGNGVLHVTPPLLRPRTPKAEHKPNPTPRKSPLPHTCKVEKDPLQCITRKGKANSCATQGINSSMHSLVDLSAEIFTDNHEMAQKVIRRLGERGEPHNWKWSDFLIMCYQK